MEKLYQQIIDVYKETGSVKETAERLGTYPIKVRRVLITEGMWESKTSIQIGELLEKAPEKADILLEIGMHCLGCPASQMETLEEACDVHGIDVEEVIKKLNA